jgi:hypothetical protein
MPIKAKGLKILCAAALRDRDRVPVLRANSAFVGLE